MSFLLPLVEAIVLVFENEKYDININTYVCHGPTVFVVSTSCPPKLGNIGAEKTICPYICGVFRLSQHVSDP